MGIRFNEFPYRANYNREIRHVKRMWLNSDLLNSFWETHEGAINLRGRIFMKKQFVKICFIFALMIGVQCIFPPPASAEEVYMGTYNSGLDAYLMTETLEFGHRRQNFDVRIKATDGEMVVYVDYHFWRERDRGAEVPHFTNSQDYRDVVSDATPVEMKIWNYVMYNAR